MSLMNDALRKKNRETMGSPVATAFIDVSQRSRISGRWRIGLAAMMLLTAASFYGIHLMRSSTGNSLVVRSPRPEPLQAPANHPVNDATAVQHQSGAAPLPISADHQLRATPSEDPPAENRMVAADLEPAPPASAVSDSMPNTGAGGPASALPPAEEQPVLSPLSTAFRTVEAPAESSQRDLNAVSRTFEPGPVQTRANDQTRSVMPRQPRSPEQPAQSTAPGEPSERTGEWNTDAAARPAPLSDGEGDLFYNKARTYHRNGRLADAIRLYRQALNANQRHPGAMLNLAAAYMQEGNYVDADPLLKQLERSHPRPQGVLLNLAIAAIGMGDPERALVDLNRAAALSDASPWEIRFHRAVALAGMNRLPEALVLYREAATERPDDPRLQFNLAVTCDALGIYAEAIAHYAAVLRAPSKPSEADQATITRRIRTIRRHLEANQSPARGQ